MLGPSAVPTVHAATDISDAATSATDLSTTTATYDPQRSSQDTAATCTEASASGLVDATPPPTAAAATTAADASGASPIASSSSPAAAPSTDLIASSLVVTSSLTTTHTKALARYPPLYGRHHDHLWVHRGL